MLVAGSRIQAKLIEEVQRDHWIVSFHGELFQVKNSTTIIFKAGLKLNLQVVNESPMQLKVLSKAHNRNLSLDVKV